MKRRRWIYWITPLVVVAALLALLRTDNRSLVERSTRVVGLAPTTIQYNWQSSHTLFVLDSEPSRFGMRARLIDVATGEETSLDAVAARCAQDDSIYGLWWNVPGGEGLLWQRRQVRGMRFTWGWEYSDLSGRSKWTVPARNGMVAVGNPWMRDGEHWVELVSEGQPTRAYVYSLAAPKRPRIVPLTIPPNVKSWPTYPSILLGFDAQGRGIATDWSPGAGHPTAIACWSFGIDPGAAPPHPFTLHVPPGERAFDLALSPQGDRLAWLLYGQPASRIPRVVKRIFPSLRPAARVELCVSRVDGTGMRSIGSQKIHAAPHSATDVPLKLRWTLDGKRISFLYQNAVYTVSAE